MSEKEIKLEVGKKYDIKKSIFSADILLCPCEFIAKDKTSAIFRDTKGDLVRIYLIDLVNRTTEHREPFKHEFDDRLYFCKEHCINELSSRTEWEPNCCSNLLYMRVHVSITEKLPEPEDENS